MDWRDQGTVLALRGHGESSAIIEVFTAEHGRHAGVVRGGASRRMAAHLQPGALVEVVWRARLEDHLGAFSVEPLRSRAAVMADGAALAGLNAACALLVFALPERAPHPELHAASEPLFDALAALAPDWTLAYLRWELALLETLGLGLDLGRCAVTGQHDDLLYVSPRTGRAVSRAGAGEWADRLLPLPSFLLGQGPATAQDLLSALALTGFFLDHRLARGLLGKPLPEARRRLAEILAHVTRANVAR
jgi:DNA repair protein RecO (recombination protein O)